MHFCKTNRDRILGQVGIHRLTAVPVSMTTFGTWVLLLPNRNSLCAGMFYSGTVSSLGEVLATFLNKSLQLSIGMAGIFSDYLNKKVTATTLWSNYKVHAIQISKPNPKHLKIWPSSLSSPSKAIDTTHPGSLNPSVFFLHPSGSGHKNTNLSNTTE